MGPGLSRRVWVYFAFWSAPWWLMAIIILTGGASGLSEFSVCRGNIFVELFFIFTVTMCLGVGVWIWLFGGDNYLVRAKMVDSSAKRLKIEYALALLGMIFIILSAFFLFRRAA